ncbi:hypothetical protein BOTBODRAFT_192749 [Botryobasidium botryosum FD-172 SS1]|uniref:G domain-containing protein n=1 Tax=Botryobasidium botryosum (strain FD-172 SS1) TaxID=930990 RepID=A0A067LUE5_BOTB1|nr:hypothetical protein BOTBODRAFT_192749 [Botryobasidium botryosum FD-172 SS1]
MFTAILKFVLLYHALLQPGCSGWSKGIHAAASDLNEKSGLAIAVMGPTGSGKTTFVNLASGSNMHVGMGLQSCTSAIQVAPPFALDDRQVTLIDTPGFDDTAKSDAQILEILATHLSQEYQAGRRLSGVIYLHRISDVRMSGISMRTFRIFRQLCGDTAMTNVAMVTTFWESVDKAVAEAREKELVGQHTFFKHAVDRGAQLLRHNDTIESAHAIIRGFLGGSPKPLLIQEQIVDQQMRLADTSAGAELDREMLEQIEDHGQEKRILQEEAEEEIREREEQARQKAEADMARHHEEVARHQREIARLQHPCRGRRGMRRVACELREL